MGSLKNLEKLTSILAQATTEGYDVFIETGCGWGASLDFASSFPFKKLFSVEIAEDAYLKCKTRFIGEPNRIFIDQGESVNFLNWILPGLDASARAIFWLDAHWPGFDCHLDHKDERNEKVALPLRKEVEAIHKWRGDVGRDIILIDDLRIYEDLPCQSGKLNPRDVPIMPKSRSLKFIDDLFEKTHEVARLSQDDGYMIVLPRGKF